MEAFWWYSLRLSNLLKVSGLNVRSRLWTLVAWYTHLLPCFIVSMSSLRQGLPITLSGSCFYSRCYSQVCPEGVSKLSCWSIRWNTQEAPKNHSISHNLTSRPGPAVKDQVHSLLYYVLCSGWGPMLASPGVMTVTSARAGGGMWSWSQTQQPP